MVGSLICAWVCVGIGLGLVNNVGFSQALCTASFGRYHYFQQTREYTLESSKPSVDVSWLGARDASGETPSHRIPCRLSPAMLGSWRCSGTSNADLVKNLRDSGIIHSVRAVQAMEATDRGYYSSQQPYQDRWEQNISLSTGRPQYLGYGATISAPHMHGHVLELLDEVIPAHNAKVLDVGCGSGYLAAAFARLAGQDATVYAMDYIPELVDLSRENLNADDENLLSSGRIHLMVGDGWKGWKEGSPFDAIHVGAAAESIPLELVSQLRVGGRMIVPVGPQSSAQALLEVERTGDDAPLMESFTTKRLLDVVYVPLVKST
ncbi:unnamed protein product [Choristocarpus tenellus]